VAVDIASISFAPGLDLEEFLISHSVEAKAEEIEQ
jgi:hypothetical protein